MRKFKYILQKTFYGCNIRNKDTTTMSNVIFFLDPLNIANIVYIKATTSVNMLRIANINRQVDNVIHRMI